ncbi:MAG: hypothetical protein LBR65_02280 [Culturomica sp.]|jgi:hypothetical protein|nr:hypothetical protein [Culturomica sp.]
MEKYKTLIENIEQATRQEVVKKNSISLLALVLFGIGVLCFLGAKSIGDPNSALPTFLYTLAVCLLLVSIVKFFMGNKVYVFRPSGSKLKKETLYFDARDRQPLFNSIEEKQFDTLKRIKRLENTGIRLDVLYAGKREFAAVQLLEYVPYTYETATPVICYYGEDARKFIENLHAD